MIVHHGFRLTNDKVLGYILLLIGLAMIFVSTFIAFRVFTGKSEPAKIFDVEAPVINLPSQNSLTLPEGFELPEGVILPQSSVEGKGFKIIPDEVFNRLLNSSLYFLAMTFVASSGAKIASIGVQLVKEVKVQFKENKPTTNQP